VDLRREIIENSNFISFFKKLICQVGTDESGPPGDQDLLHPPRLLN
jgi:hypothetical protein